MSDDILKKILAKLEGLETGQQELKMMIAGLMERQDIFEGKTESRHKEWLNELRSTRIDVDYLIKSQESMMRN